MTLVDAQNTLSRYPFLGCPNCHGPFRPTNQGLFCVVCDRTFSNERGVPILFPRDVSFSSDAVTSHPQKSRGFARRNLTYGRHLGNNHERIVNMCSGGHVVSIGGGPQRDRPEYVNFNLAPMQNVDIVGDANQLPFQNASIDGVVCNAVLEHVRNPWQVVSEIRRTLKPGGIIYIEVPFLQHYHPSPEDFWRFTIQGTREICRDFDQIDIGICCGPMSTFVELSESYALLIAPQGKLVRNLIKGIVRFCLYPTRLIESVIMLLPESHTIANGFYFVGQQKQPSKPGIPERVPAINREVESMTLESKNTV